MKSRLEGSLDDFIFESSKVTLPIKKAERGTHIKLVTVHRGGKTFKRKQRVGRKERDKVSYKSSHDFIKNEIKLDIDMREGEKFTKDPLMGEQIIVSDDKGNKLDVWIKETPDMIQLSTIGSHEKGTGIGTKYLLGLKNYADVSGKKLVIPNMTPEGKKYFSRFSWLKDDHIKLEWIEDGELQGYYPENTMSYISKKELKNNKLSEKESLEWKTWQNYYKEKLFRPSVSPHEDYYSQSILIATSPQHAKDLIKKYQMADPSSMGIDLVADFELLYKRTKGDVPKKSNMHIDNLIKIKSLEDSGISGLVGGMHEGETYIVQFKDGSQAIHKTMLMGDIIGEVGAYETSKILNWDIVPETIQCNYGKGEGSCQKWVENSSEPYDGLDDNATLIEEKHINDLSKIFIMDMILGNYDRHSGNIIIDKNDKVWAIDNEMIGKLNNAEIHSESLNEWAKNGEGSFVPMISVLKNSFSDDTEMYQKFKNHVDENLIRVRKHQNKIIKYW